MVHGQLSVKQKHSKGDKTTDYLAKKDYLSYEK